MEFNPSVKGGWASAMELKIRKGNKIGNRNNTSFFLWEKRLKMITFLLKYFILGLPQQENVSVPLRSCSRVTDRCWCSCSVVYCVVNSSSHLMKEGQEDKPWSREFMKHVLPRFRRPGTSPAKRIARAHTTKSEGSISVFSRNAVWGVAATENGSSFRLNGVLFSVVGVSVDFWCFT